MTAVAVAWFAFSVCLWYGFFTYTAPTCDTPCTASGNGNTGRHDSVVHKEVNNDPHRRVAKPGCVTTWTETIRDKYTIMSPFKGHINYKEYFEHYSYRYAYNDDNTVHV